MPGLTSIVTAFVNSTPAGVAKAWEWLQLACRPELELPDSVTQRCIETIVAAGTEWSSSQEDGITLQVARQMYNQLLSRHDDIINDLTAEKASEAAKAVAAATKAKKEHEAEVKECRKKYEEVKSDLCFMHSIVESLLMTNSGRRVLKEQWGLEAESRLEDICRKNRLATL